MIPASKALTHYRAVWEASQARPDQLPPDGDWQVWLILSGRGWGKTRTGAEWIAYEAAKTPNTRWAIVAPTWQDARDTCVEGVSGVLPILTRYRRLTNYNRSLGELTLTNGSRIKLFSGDEPDRLRGPQHHGAWCDEVAAWRYPDTWDQLAFGLRLGSNPRIVATTTPRPTKLIRSLMTAPNTHLTRGSTFDNAANLSAAALERLRERYEGTRIGRQELLGELLEDVEGALWTRDLIDNHRVTRPPEQVIKRVVAVDPATTAGPDSDLTGIIVASAGTDGHLYVEADYTLRGSPEEWASAAVNAYHQHHAHHIVIETNQGGDMAKSTLKVVDGRVPIKGVTASKGKRTRAEPVAALYEQGRAHHVGALTALEDQLCEWVPGMASPDRLDAMVWAATDLMLGRPQPPPARLLTT